MQKQHQKQCLHIQQIDRKMGCGSISTHNVQGVPSQILTLNKIYQRKQLIGSGTFGKVYLCVNKLNGLEYALKVVEITAKNKEEAVKQIENLKSQIRVLKKLSHPNIIKYYSFDISEDNKHVEIVLEYAQRGSLKTYITERGPLSQTEAVSKTVQILQGLKYLHKQNIVHRDLKCANILVMEDGTLKITDFGTAKYIKVTSSQNISLCPSLKGTPYYMAPEILRRTGHNISADIWSLGCLLIQMLSAKAPWISLTTNFEQIISYIISGIHPPFPKGLTDECECFLSSCLHNVPSQRLTCQELLKHRWIDGKSLREDDLSKYKKASLSKTNDDNYEEVTATKVDSKPGRKMQKIREIDTYISERTRESERTRDKEKKKVGQRQSAKPKKQKTASFLYSDEYLKHPEQIEELDYHQPVSRKLFTEEKTNQTNIKVNTEEKTNYTSIKVSQTTPQVKLPESLISGVKEVKQQVQDIENIDNVHVDTAPFKGDVGTRIKTQQTSHEEVINTMISREERVRYLQRQKILREQREEERKKWERELKEGANYLRKEINSRYNL